MQNISIQKEFGWCTIHTLANALRDKDFKELLSNKAFMSCDVDDVTEALHLCGYPEWEMESVAGVVGANYPPIPNRYLMDILKIENAATIPKNGMKHPAIPYFLTVQIKSPHWHYVAVIKCGAKFLYIDPYKNDVIVLKKLGHIFKYFTKCIAVERIVENLGSKGKKKEYIIICGENLGYNKLI
jgi:hypothetical protein